MHSDKNGAGNHASRPGANHDGKSGSKRAERARIAALFQDVERPVAPPSLYEGLMAKIAVERAEQRAGVWAAQPATDRVRVESDARDRARVGSDTPERNQVRARLRAGSNARTRALVGSEARAGSGKRFGWPKPFADEVPGPFASLLAIVLGWCFVVLTMAPLPGRVDGAVALARGVTGEVWQSVLQALAAVLSVVPSVLSLIPSALEPMAIGLMWGAIGWGVTVAVLAVTTRLSETI